MPNFRVPVAAIPYPLRVFNLINKLSDYNIQVALTDVDSGKVDPYLLLQLENIAYTIDRLKKDYPPLTE